MKNSRFKWLISLIAICLGVSFTSCSKSEVEPASMPDSKPQNDLTKALPWGAHKWWAVGSPAELCVFPGVNCFDPIDIFGMALTNLDASIGNGTTGVKIFFNVRSNWLPLFPDLNSGANNSFLIKLQSGNYSMEKKVGNNNLVIYVAKGGSPYEEFALPVFVK